MAQQGAPGVCHPSALAPLSVLGGDPPGPRKTAEVRAPTRIEAEMRIPPT